MTIFTFTKQVSDEERVPGETAPSQAGDIAPNSDASEEPLNRNVSVPFVAMTPFEYLAVVSGLFLVTSLDSNLEIYHVKCPGCGAETFFDIYSPDEHKVLFHAGSSCRIAERAFQALRCSNDLVERSGIRDLSQLSAEHLQFERCSKSDWAITYRVPDVTDVALRLKLRHQEPPLPTSFECEVRIGMKNEFETIANGTLIHLCFGDPDHDARLSNYLRFPKGWRDEFLAMAELWATAMKLIEF